MRKGRISDYVPAASVCLAASVAYVFFLLGVIPRWTFCHGGYWYGAFLYHFSHANIFHLAANAWALLAYRPAWKTLAVGYIVASLSALLLMAAPSASVSCGMSGLFFGCYATHYAYYRKRFLGVLLLQLPFLIIPAFDARVHVMSFLLSYLIWLWFYRHTGKR